MSTYPQDRGKMHPDDLVMQAREMSEVADGDVLAAAEVFHLNGFSDQESGNVEAPSGHFYRVSRWLVLTDDQGFKDLEEFDTEAEARERFRELDEVYGEWADR